MKTKKSDYKKLFLVEVKSGPLDYLKQLCWLTDEQVKAYNSRLYAMTRIVEAEESSSLMADTQREPISANDILDMLIDLNQ
jgi:hypothetical protein